jgi:cytoskeletal protein RodZ
MNTLGTKLRTARELQSLSLDEISARTKIRPQYLQAIEGDSLESIPGGFFSRSFVRQYATELGLNPDDVERDLGQVTLPPVETVPVEKVLREYRASPSGLTKIDEEGKEFAHEASFLKESSAGPVWVAIAVLLTVGSAGYLTWTQRPDLFEPVLAMAKSPASPASTTAVPVLPPAASAPTVEAPAAAPTPAVEPATAAPVEVAILAKELVWLRITADGRRVFDGTMDAGETRKVTGQEMATVRSGNAGGIEITFNGKPIGPVGPRGLVRTVVFTPREFEIRSSPPPPALSATAAVVPAP